MPTPKSKFKPGDNLRIGNQDYIVMATKKQDPGLGTRPPANSYPNSLIHTVNGQTVQIMRLPIAQPVRWDDQPSRAPIP